MSRKSKDVRTQLQREKEKKQEAEAEKKVRREQRAERLKQRGKSKASGASGASGSSRRKVKVAENKKSAEQREAEKRERDRARQVAYIRAVDSATGNIFLMLSQMLVLRPAGKQHDHTLAFAEVVQALRSALLRTQQDQGIHITPIYEELCRMAKVEIVTYTDYLLDLPNKQNGEKNDFETVRDIYQELSRLGYIKEPMPDLKKILDTTATGVELYDTEQLMKMIRNISLGIQQLPNYKKHKLYKSFLNASSRLLPYIDLCNLNKDLSLQYNAILKKNEEFDEQVRTHVRENVEPLVADGPEKEPFLNKMYESHMKFSLKTGGQLGGIVESLANTFARYFNKLPFAAFIKIKDVSGAGEKGGKNVADARDRLLALRLGPLQSLSKEAMEAAIKPAIDDIITLLDFQVLEKLSQAEKARTAVFGQRGGIDAKAKNLLLRRSNDRKIFIQVVARQWRFAAMAFPNLKDNNNLDILRHYYITRMFDDWKIAEADRKALMEQIIAVIQKADNIKLDKGVLRTQPLTPTPKLLLPRITQRPAPGVAESAAAGRGSAFSPFSQSTATALSPSPSALTPLASPALLAVPSAASEDSLAPGIAQGSFTFGSASAAQAESRMEIETEGKEASEMKRASEIAAQPSLEEQLDDWLDQSLQELEQMREQGLEQEAEQEEKVDSESAASRYLDRDQPRDDRGQTSGEANPFSFAAQSDLPPLPAAPFTFEGVSAEGEREVEGKTERETVLSQQQQPPVKRSTKRTRATTPVLSPDLPPAATPVAAAKPTDFPRATPLSQIRSGARSVLSGARSESAMSRSPIIPGSLVPSQSPVPPPTKSPAPPPIKKPKVSAAGRGQLPSVPTSPRSEDQHSHRSFNVQDSDSQSSFPPLGGAPAAPQSPTLPASAGSERSMSPEDQFPTLAPLTPPLSRAAASRPESELGLHFGEVSHAYSRTQDSPQSGSRSPSPSQSEQNSKPRPMSASPVSFAAPSQTQLPADVGTKIPGKPQAPLTHLSAARASPPPLTMQGSPTLFAMRPTPPVSHAQVQARVAPTPSGSVSQTQGKPKALPVSAKSASRGSASQAPGTLQSRPSAMPTLQFSPLPPMSPLPPPLNLNPPSSLRPQNPSGSGQGDKGGAPEPPKKGGGASRLGGSRES